jgi:hypothetical protein
MAKAELEIIRTPEALTDKVLSIPTDSHPEAFMTELGGGVLRFAEAAFPNTDRERIFVQSNDREPEGRGPHFDVYGKLLNEDYPWLAVFNLSGLALLSAMDLPEDLAKSYFDRYPVPTDAAFDARRLFSLIALQVPDAETDVSMAQVGPGSGFVLPQKIEGPHIVHDIVPTDAQNPGKFVKLVVPASSNEAKTRMKDGGYEPLDELLTRGIGGVILETGSQKDREVTSSVQLRLDTPPASRFDRPKRRCNLD